MEPAPSIKVARPRYDDKGYEGNNKSEKGGPPDGSPEIAREEGQQEEQDKGSLDEETVEVSIVEREVIAPQKRDEDKGRPGKKGIKLGGEGPNRR